eukprot:gene39366-51878_t
MFSSKSPSFSLIGPLTPKADIYYRLIWCDSAGLRRCRVVMTSSEDTKEFVNGVGLTSATMSLPSWGDVVVRGIGTREGVVGETRLCFDKLAIFRPTWSDNERLCLGTFYNPDRSSWSCCPRSALKDVVNAAVAQGYTFRVGFETEFALMTTS